MSSCEEPGHFGNCGCSPSLRPKPAPQPRPPFPCVHVGIRKFFDPAPRPQLPPPLVVHVRFGNCGCSPSLRPRTAPRSPCDCPPAIPDVIIRIYEGCGGCGSSTNQDCGGCGSRTNQDCGGCGSNANQDCGGYESGCSYSKLRPPPPPPPPRRPPPCCCKQCSEEHMRMSTSCTRRCTVLRQMETCSCSSGRKRRSLPRIRYNGRGECLLPMKAYQRYMILLEVVVALRCYSGSGSSEFFYAHV
ncbi:hypothetical protein AVEN_257050-1 [Araneus ventricosus]|uniref:Uncharacterized protein n=1 Tax=Araneus ventricosus TaxID=182803 RepID=A0A4Y2U5P3_ARAVE|nr:hypothetical protein AVEN_257050-1 [Araneus ventricosus]